MHLGSRCLKALEELIFPVSTLVGEYENFLIIIAAEHTRSVVEDCVTAMILLMDKILHQLIVGIYKIPHDILNNIPFIFARF